jgi:hypothetical protein
LLGCVDVKSGRSCLGLHVLAGSGGELAASSRGPPDDGAHLVEGDLEDVVEYERGAFGR